MVGRDGAERSNGALIIARILLRVMDLYSDSGRFGVFEAVGLTGCCRHIQMAQLDRSEYGGFQLTGKVSFSVFGIFGTVGLLKHEIVVIHQSTLRDIVVEAGAHCEPGLVELSEDSCKRRVPKCPGN